MDNTNGSLEMESQEQGDIIDGVHRYPSTGISVIVVGCGPGGLLAALEAWRKGNEVMVLEQAKEFSPAGDFFTITPSGLSTFKEYPILHVEHQRNANDAAIRWLTANSRLIEQREPDWKLSPDGHAAGQTKGSMFNPRSQLQTMMKDQCSRVGIPFHFGKKVVEYVENDHQATVITSDGEEYLADIVIAADGIASISHELVHGKQIPFASSGHASARCGFPRSAIDPKSKAAHLLNQQGERPEFNVYLGSSGDLIIAIASDFLGIVFTHKDEEGTGRESWAPKIYPKTIKEKYFQTGEWDERVVDFIDQIPVTMADWCLTWREPEDKWVSPKGRVVQIGDAAHPFLPTSGNGATQALEDAITLPECLRVGGKGSAHISTRVYNLLRHRRVNIIQRIAFTSRNYLDIFNDKDLTFFKNPITWGRWNWGLRPEDYARERYEEAKSAISRGEESQFEHKNIPPGYKHEPWTMETEFKRLRKDPSAASVKANGYWGYI